MDFLRFLEECRTPFLDTVFRFITLLGAETVAIAVFCVLFWCIDKKVAYKTGFTFFCSGLTAQAAKITFRVPRPWVRDTSFTAVPQAVSGATGYSFPSGHTQSATSLYGTLAISFKNKLFKALCIIIFLLVGFSRMYLGVHTPADVLTGFLIAALFALLAHIFVDGEVKSRKKECITSLLMVVFSVLLCVYATILYNSSVVEYKYVSDCIKAGSAGLAFSIGWYTERIHICFSEKCKPAKQVIKCVLGFSAVAIVKLLFDYLPQNLFFNSLEYFVLVMWCVVIFPIIIKKAKFFAFSK